MPEIIIPRIKGMNRTVPYGASVQQDGASAVVLNNLRPNGRGLGRRPGMVSYGTPPTIPTIFAPKQTSFDVVHIQEIDVRPFFEPRWIVFTERDGFLGNPANGTWGQINPRHTDGTVSLTNTSATVTGSGTLWRTRGILNEDYILLPDGNYYQIDTVDSETQITLASGYGGATASGETYEIVRTFGFDVDTADLPNVPFVVNQVGDLYVAGMVSGGFINAAGGTNTWDGGVFKIAQGADGTKTSWGTGDITYMVSGRNEVESGVDTFGGDGYNTSIYGFGKLSDGRLVAAGHFLHRPTGVSGNRRIWYSSNLLPSVWADSPGGFTDSEEANEAITAASFSSNSVAFHHLDGIVIGELTGQDEPPLRLRPSKAAVGAIGPRLLTRIAGGPAIPGREVYVGSDLAIYAFSGADSQPADPSGMSLEFEHIGTIGPSAQQIRNGFMYFDGQRAEVAIAFSYDDFDKKTREVRLNTRTGESWRCVYPGFLRHGFAPRLSLNKKPEEQRAFLSSQTNSSWFWRLDENVSNDSAWVDFGDSNGVYAQIEGIDGGSPSKMKVAKQVLVFFAAAPHATVANPAGFGPVVEVRTDREGSALTAVLKEVVMPLRFSPVRGHVYQEEQAAVFYLPKENCWHAMDLWISSPDDDEWPVELTRIVIDYEFVGDQRATD